MVPLIGAPRNLRKSSAANNQVRWHFQPSAGGSTPATARRSGKYIATNAPAISSERNITLR
jgi:hypothetical protein